MKNVIHSAECTLCSSSKNEKHEPTPNEQYEDIISISNEQYEDVISKSNDQYEDKISGSNVQYTDDDELKNHRQNSRLDFTGTNYHVTTNLNAVYIGETSRPV